MEAVKTVVVKHNLEVSGSNPDPATMNIKKGRFHLNLNRIAPFSFMLDLES